jgi:pseudouridine-5'-phosphate glycosidase
MRISEEVRQALKENRPVVALESTIISFGLPYPDNFKTAMECQKAVRESGAIPATTGIINGELVVGMSEEEIDKFADGSLKIVKVSRRDLPVAMAMKLNGATTVSATMILASLAGIKFMATGGIGGVHAKAQETFDISADLEELAKTPVTVVCSGPKAFLDLGLTMEYLETHGVTVVGYGTDTVPRFYIPYSSYKVDFNAKSPLDVVNMVLAKEEAKLTGGLLVCVPAPEDEFADKKALEETMEVALKHAEEKGISGKDITPFVLSEINSKTGGASLKANEIFVRNNARVASLIAEEYCLKEVKAHE